MFLDVSVSCIPIVEMQVLFKRNCAIAVCESVKVFIYVRSLGSEWIQQVPAQSKATHCDQLMQKS